MAELLSAAQVTAELNRDPSRVWTLAELRSLAESVTLDAIPGISQGSVTVLYSGFVDADTKASDIVSGMISRRESVRVLDKTQRFTFLGSDAFLSAVARSHGISDYLLIIVNDAVNGGTIRIDRSSQGRLGIRLGDEQGIPPRATALVGEGNRRVWDPVRGRRRSRQLLARDRQRRHQRRSQQRCRRQLGARSGRERWAGRRRRCELGLRSRSDRYAARNRLCVAQRAANAARFNPLGVAQRQNGTNEPLQLVAPIVSTKATENLDTGGEF